MAIRAIHRRLRIIKRARALPGHAAGLPVVIFIEAANPPVMIHGDIQMHLVARRAKLRCVPAHKRLQEGAAVRFRIQSNHKVMQLPNEGIFARGQFMKLRILQEKVSLAHGAFHLHDAVAH